MRHLLESIESAHTIKSIHEWRQSSMETEHTGLNERSKRQEIEQVCKHLPHVHSSILSQALIVEAITTIQKGHRQADQQITRDETGGVCQCVHEMTESESLAGFNDPLQTSNSEGSPIQIQRSIEENY